MKSFRQHSAHSTNDNEMFIRLRQRINLAVHWH